MKTLIAAMLSFLLSGCFATRTNKAAEELAIREATFRYQIARDASRERQTAICYFLSIYTADGQESDPPESFMKRFAEKKPLVKKFSECIRPTKNGVADKATGERGVILSTGSIKWASDTDAEIYVTEYAGKLGAFGETFYLKKINGEWKVVRAEMQWIS